MYSLDNDFKELLAKLREPGSLNPALSDPLFYFAYPAEQMLEVKERLPRCIVNLKKRIQVKTSLSELMWNGCDSALEYVAGFEHEADYAVERWDSRRSSERGRVYRNDCGTHMRGRLRYSCSFNRIRVAAPLFQNENTGESPP